MTYTCLMGFSPAFYKKKIIIYKADGKNTANAYLQSRFNH